MKSIIKQNVPLCGRNGNHFHPIGWRRPLFLWLPWRQQSLLVWKLEIGWCSYDSKSFIRLESILVWNSDYWILDSNGFKEKKGVKRKKDFFLKNSLKRKQKG